MKAPVMIAAKTLENAKAFAERTKIHQWAYLLHDEQLQEWGLDEDPVLLVLLGDGESLPQRHADNFKDLSHAMRVFIIQDIQQ